MTLLQESNTAAGVAMDAVLKRPPLTGPNPEPRNSVLRIALQGFDLVILLAFHTDSSSATWLYPLRQSFATLNVVPSAPSPKTPSLFISAIRPTTDRSVYEAVLLLH